MAQAVIKIIVILAVVAVLIVGGVLWMLAMAMHNYGQMVAMEKRKDEWNGEKKK